MNVNTLSASPLVFTIDNFFSNLSCKMLIKDTEALKYKDAPITIDGKTEDSKSLFLSSNLK